jgi:hypothetical protein
MRLEYDEFHDSYILVFDEKDKCHFCKHSLVCPLIRAMDKGEFVLSRYREVPTWEFCDMYEMNDRIKKIEKRLMKNKKYKEK